MTRDDIERWGYQSVAEVLAHSVGLPRRRSHSAQCRRARHDGRSGRRERHDRGHDRRAFGGVSKHVRQLARRRARSAESIEQIEIIRGPASALYGADAFLGVVNIITEKPDEMRPIRARASVGLSGRHPTSRFDGATGGKLGPFDLMFGAAGELSDRSGLEMPPIAGADSALQRGPTAHGRQLEAPFIGARDAARLHRAAKRQARFERVRLRARARGRLRQLGAVDERDRCERAAGGDHHRARSGPPQPRRRLARERRPSISRCKAPISREGSSRGTAWRSRAISFMWSATRPIAASIRSSRQGGFPRPA